MRDMSPVIWLFRNCWGSLLSAVIYLIGINVHLKIVRRRTRERVDLAFQHGYYCGRVAENRGETPPLTDEDWKRTRKRKIRVEVHPNCDDHDHDADGYPIPKRPDA